MDLLKKELFPRDHHHLPIFLSLLAMIIAFSGVLFVSNFDNAEARQETPESSSSAHMQPFSIKDCGSINITSAQTPSDASNQAPVQCFWSGFQSCVSARDRSRVKMTVNITDAATNTVTSEVLITMRDGNTCTIATTTSKKLSKQQGGFSERGKTGRPTLSGTPFPTRTFPPITGTVTGFQPNTTRH